MYKHRNLAAVLSGALLLLVLCGTSASASSYATRAIKLSGTPVTLGVITGVNDPAESEPWIPQAAKVAAAAVNAAGGIQGHPVRIVFCDDQQSTQQATLCAQKLLVQDKALMLVGGDGSEDAAVLPLLQSQHTIQFGTLGASIAALQAPSQEYIIGGSEAATQAISQMVPSSDHKVTYVLADSAIAQQAAKASDTFGSSVHVSNVVLPETATTYETPCLQLKESGAQVAIMDIVSSQIAPFIQTCEGLGLSKILWVNQSAVITPQVVKTISKYKAPNIVVEGYNPKIFTQFNADISKYGSKVGGVSNSVVDTAVESWLAVKLLPSLVQKAGSLNGAAIEAWLGKQTAYNPMNATPPINYSCSPIAPEPAIHNIDVYEGKITNGKIVAANNDQPFPSKLTC